MGDHAAPEDTSTRKPSARTKKPGARARSYVSRQPAEPEREGQPGTFTVQWVNPPTERPPGVKHHTFHSASMNRDVGFNIYTPPDYATSNKRYPTTYWLHGIGGNESTGIEYARILQNAILAEQLPPMIMVFPNGGRATLYYDSADGTIMAETSIIKELVPLIDRDYRTLADRRARAIEGFSMGGFGALRLAFKYPELFCSVVSGAPAISEWERVSSLPLRRDLPMELPKRMWNNDRNVFESDHAHAWLIRNADIIRSDLRIRIVVGDRDQLKRYIDPFHDKLADLKIPHEYEVLEGMGHERIRVYNLVGLKGLQFHATSFATERT